MLNPGLILLTIVLYVVNNLFFKWKTHGWIQIFFISYFNDLICPLLFLSYVNILMMTTGKEIKRLPVLLLLALVASLVWEFVAPIVKPTSVTDLIDIVCYLVGSVVYWLLMRLNCRLRRCYDA